MQSSSTRRSSKRASFGGSTSTVLAVLLSGAGSAHSEVFGQEVKDVHKWLSEDPKCDHDTPSWKELRHILTLPDDYITPDMYQEAIKHSPEVEKHEDWRRMYGAEVIDASRGYFEMFVQDPGLLERCYLGVVTFFFYLARWKLYGLQDIELAMQVIRPLDAILKTLPGVHMNRYNGLEETASGSPFDDVLGIGQNTTDVSGLAPTPQESDNYHWPITAHMLAQFELDVMKALGSGAKQTNTLYDAEKQETIWIGNAYNVWPSDLLPSTDATLAHQAGMEDNSIEKSWTSSKATLFSPLESLGNAYSIYVYDPLEVPELRTMLRSGSSYCRGFDTGAEVDAHHWFLSCPQCRTGNPQEADFFFVPQYSGCLAQQMKLLQATSQGEEDEQMSNVIVEAFERLIPQLKYFARSNGRDHIFALTGSGSHLSTLASSKLKESILLFDHVGPWFHFAKDILIPMRERLDTLVQQHALALSPDSIQSADGAVLSLDQDNLLSPRDRPWRKRKHTGVALLTGKEEGTGATEEYGETALKSWNVRHIAAGRPSSGKEFFGDMHLIDRPEGREELNLPFRDGKFCYLTAPPLDVTRAFFSGCVPVIIEDDYRMPFQQFITSATPGKNVKGNKPRTSKSSSPWAENAAGAAGFPDGNEKRRAQPAIKPGYNFFLQWPKNMVTRDLAVYTRQWIEKTATHVLGNLAEMRCWYVYPASVLSADFLPARMGKLCPRGRSQNALMALHASLVAKKATPKFATNVFSLVNPKSGTYNIVSEVFSMVQRFETKMPTKK
ncbi:unnamed protein product [Amoebophrya sp. A25]|nr:unnamed protein product [Amoebophrya sp. A25]|eukprot:GSA25T00018493001.1